MGRLQLPTIVCTVRHVVDKVIFRWRKRILRMVSGEDVAPDSLRLYEWHRQIVLEFDWRQNGKLLGNQPKLRAEQVSGDSKKKWLVPVKWHDDRATGPLTVMNIWRLDENQEGSDASTRCDP